MEKNTDKVQKGNSQTNEKHTVGQSVKLSISNEGLEYYRNRIQQSGQEKYDELYGAFGYISVKLRSDWTHFNAYGYYSKGVGIYKKGVELGYWE